MSGKKLEEVEWNVSGINQYATEVSVEEVTVRVPIRETFIGSAAFIPRDENFSKKEFVRDVIRYRTNHLPVATPEATISSTTEKYIKISYEDDS